MNFNRFLKTIFLSEFVGPLAGDFSFNDTGTTGLTGTLETVQSGVAATDNWIYQSDWNVDKLDGTGASGMTLDPTKLNVYQIRYKWLGSGCIGFYIESNITGEFVLVHIIQRANQFQEVSIQNPSLKCGYVAYNTADPGDTGVIVMGILFDMEKENPVLIDFGLSVQISNINFDANEIILLKYFKYQLRIYRFYRLFR